MSAASKKGRNVHGVLLLDKPMGMTSNGALQVVKRLFNARKAGHTGSLDPLATGVLPLCLGEATKISGFLLDATKGYRSIFKLGVRTDTGDADGSIIASHPVGVLSLETINAVLARFAGEIVQIPPMHSAIKQNGVALYKLAHQGREVERPPRSVTIHELTLLRFENDELEVSVRCSKGTYIRVLAEDIGSALGCGAHVAQLRRDVVGPYTLTQAVTLQQLQDAAQQGIADLDARLLPIDSALVDWPGVKLSDDAAYFLKRGQTVFIPRTSDRGLVRLFNGQMNFLGIGQVLDDGRVAP
ncbi:MAG: tRNA pseudouridine(55) synthase TruB, partial [Gammaproteobacteria bacterium]|nr:tRNA pseudouridine(55) synthase TruB [Gammaproteobacteria bacterium]